MISLERIGTSITGSCNGVSFGLTYSPEKFALLKDLKGRAEDAVSLEDLKVIVDEFMAAAKEDVKALAETACKELFVNQVTGKFYIKLGNQVLKPEIPKAMVDRIIKSIELEMDPTPIIKACIRFMRNPNFTAKKFKLFANYINKTTVLADTRDKLVAEGYTTDVATERATVYQTPITKEGLICTYKVSEEVDFKYELDANGKKVTVPRYGAKIDPDTGLVTYDIPEFIDGRIFRPAVQQEQGDAFELIDLFDPSNNKVGHRIKVGALHRLPEWSQVDCTDGEACVKGLHVGNIDYIRGYQNSNTVTHNVFIDPMYIGAFTDEGNGAIRVKEYFVHSSLAGITKTLYHSSGYGAHTDKEWAKIKVDLLEKIQHVSLEQAEDLDTLMAL